MLTVRVFAASFALLMAWNVCAQLPDQSSPKTNLSKQQAKSDQRGIEQSPLVIKVVPPLADEEKIATDKKDREEKSEADWWLVKLTGILAAIGFLQLIVFGLQARRLRQTIEEMKVATKATDKAANAAVKAASLSEQALHLLERADVYLEKIDISPKTLPPGPNTVFTLIYKNFGRSRASRCEAISRIGIEGAPTKGEPNTVRFEMGANSTANSPFAPIGHFTTEETFRGIVAGTVKLKFASTICYSDVFGKRHGLRSAGTYIYPSSFFVDLNESYEIDDQGNEKK